MVRSAASLVVSVRRERRTDAQEVSGRWEVMARGSVPLSNRSANRRAEVTSWPHLASGADVGAGRIAYCGASGATTASSSEPHQANKTEVLDMAGSANDSKTLKKKKRQKATKEALREGPSIQLTSLPPLEDRGELLTVPVDIGKYSPGQEGGKDSIGVSIRNANITIEQSESYLCGSQIEIRLVKDPNASDDIPDQMTFGDEDGDAIELTADVASFRRSPIATNATLSFDNGALTDEDRLNLLHISLSSGKLRARFVCRTESAKSNGDAHDDDYTGGLEGLGPKQQMRDEA